MTLPSCQNYNNRLFSQFVCCCCLLWVIAFLLFGGKGKLLSIGIGMIPPLVVAATLGSNMGRRRPSSNNIAVPKRLGGGGDWNLYRGTIGLVIFPLLLQTISVAVQYAAQNPDKVANQLGVSTLPALALSFIPVTRYSQILTLLGWSPPFAIATIHVKLGWYVVAAAALHILYYTYVWLTKHEASWQIWVFNVQCFFDPDAVVPLPCHQCDCPRRLFYQTGAVAGLALAAITMTSLPYARQHCYALFYRVHVVAAPIMILFLYMHWSKTSFYLSGGVIVYLASWAPSYLEQRQWRRGPNHHRTTTTASATARIVAVDCIPCHDGRNVIALTIATASKLVGFGAGQYVKLHAPVFSSHVAHPFTVITGLAASDDGTIQIMFRQVGAFTTALCEAFVQTATENARRVATQGPESPLPLSSAGRCCLPMVYLDGFHGGGVDRVDQMRHHDHVVLIAGGIGITPMLTMISHLIGGDSDHDDDYNSSSSSSSPLTSVTLHWTCRDATLVRYVKERYFDAWEEHLSLSSRRQNVAIQCIVHVTMTTEAGAASCYGSTVEASGPAIVRYTVADSDQVGRPFEPSLMSENQSLTWRRYIAAMNMAIVGVSTLVVYVLYYKVPSKDNVLKALYVPLFVVAWAMIVSLGVVRYASSRSRRYQAVPNSDFFGPGATTLKAKSSFKLPHGDEGNNKGCCTWTEQTGRPAISELMEGLDRAAYPAVFLCGPASLRSSVEKNLQRSSSHHGGNGLCSKTTTTNRTALYVEHFDM
jgi:ferredoxin-NADP reductase